MFTESEEELDKIINSKRIRYPVFNISDIIGEVDEEVEEEKEAKEAKKRER